MDIYFKILIDSKKDPYDYTNVEGFVVGRGFRELDNLSPAQLVTSLTEKKKAIGILFGYSELQLIQTTFLDIIGFKSQGFAASPTLSSNGFSKVKNNGLKPKVTTPGRKAPATSNFQFNTLLINTASTPGTLVPWTKDDLLVIVSSILSKSKVQKDLEKIKFGLSNIKVSGSDKNNLLGLQVTKSGFHYVGVTANGLREQPVFFILYHDGKTFRGYVPNNGNVYNTLNKSAFGVNTDRDREWVDESFCRGYNSTYSLSKNLIINNVDFDWNILGREIETRIMIV